MDTEDQTEHVNINGEYPNLLYAQPISDDYRKRGTTSNILYDSSCHLKLE